MKTCLRSYLLSAVSLALLAAARVADAVESSPRPNIIFLLTDDQRDNTLGAMGHPSVKTPNLDALTTPYHGAKENVVTFIMGEGMTQFLDTKPKEKPFCLSVSFNVPHGSQTTSMFTAYPSWTRMTRAANENPKLKGSPFYDTLYRDLDISLPADTCTDPYRFIPKFMLDQDKGRRQTYSYNYDLSTCREHHVRYYQTITGLDHVIGGLLADLKRRGLDQNTIILFGSDHGLLMGEYGMGGKGLLLDLATKIPCIIHDPRTPQELRGRQLDQIVSSLDYTRTILDYAGIEAPAEMEGHSLRPLVEGKETSWRDELFIESLFTMRDNPFQEGMRTSRWKYIRMYDGVMSFKETDVDFQGRDPEFEMLFDLEADPAEQHNLATDPTHTAILDKLRTKTAAHSSAINQRRTDSMKAHSVQLRTAGAAKKPGTK